MTSEASGRVFRLVLLIVWFDDELYGAQDTQVKDHEFRFGYDRG